MENRDKNISESYTDLFQEVRNFQGFKGARKGSIFFGYCIVLAAGIFLIPFFLILTYKILSVIYLIIVEFNIQEILLGILMLLCAMLPLWYIIFRYINYITVGIYSEHKLNNIGDLLENLNQSWILYTQSHENIDQILNQIGLIYKASKNLSWLAKYKKGGSSIYRSLAEKEYIFCLSILKILNSDLSIQIEKQQLILESVKSEVEKNLSGTPELLEVSEAQKLRLDRQIEQFEELQKRLVKIP